MTMADSETIHQIKSSTSPAAAVARHFSGLSSYTRVLLSYLAGQHRHITRNEKVASSIDAISEFSSGFFFKLQSV
jgi:hypothetical protein